MKLGKFQILGNLFAGGKNLEVQPQKGSKRQKDTQRILDDTKDLSYDENDHLPHTKNFKHNKHQILKQMLSRKIKKLKEFYYFLTKHKDHQSHTKHMEHPSQIEHAEGLSKVKTIEYPSSTEDIDYPSLDKDIKDPFPTKLHRKHMLNSSFATQTEKKNSANSGPMEQPS